MKNDHDRMASGAIIPFQPRAIDKDTIEVSTIVALVAVTILHSPDEGPEDKLVEMIEQSGEAEIIEVMDAFDAHDRRRLRWRLVDICSTLCAVDLPVLLLLECFAWTASTIDAGQNVELSLDECWRIAKLVREETRNDARVRS